MQFSYRDQRDILVEKDHAADFAMVVAESVKEKYHEIASFTLEVSLPTLITENESVILSHMKKKYASEVWFQEKFSFEHIISVKDALKLSITPSLETLLGVKSSVSDFRIRLTYEHVDAPSAENRTGKNHCNKRIKSGNGFVKCTNETVQSGDVSDFNFQLQKVGQPCHMTLTFSTAPVYIGGRYLKLSRNVSQTRWIIDDERKGDASVEELIGENILPTCNGDGYKFHAAGREDIDVRMLGSGRPFLIEIQNARHLPSEASIKEMEKLINSLESNLIRVKHLKIWGSQGWSLMREGEAEKQKQYAALVWISRSIKDDDLEAVSSLKDLKVLQRTPIRVLHRRSPLDREKIIHWMKIEKIAGSSQYFLLHLCTQAGTYIKEFVHGDLGRTHPSIGSILGCRAECEDGYPQRISLNCLAFVIKLPVTSIVSFLFISVFSFSDFEWILHSIFKFFSGSYNYQTTLLLCFSDMNVGLYVQVAAAVDGLGKGLAATVGGFRSVNTGILEGGVGLG
ncbi:hypothetical protein L1987_32556 [Smallanthus sonchifolius]|uniref:Uncharacterized protein n=1 Tax=Smallanthus sonchifolius TaxID=185202 RepID=A0ACB9HQ99_9ASTR|nr:hypothetical protein L1987_32556 [Smallanthus sonchifolius]